MTGPKIPNSGDPKKSTATEPASDSAVRIDRPAEEAWFRRDASDKFVAAYQLGRLLNCRDWLRVRRGLPRRSADARRHLAQVDASLIGLATAIKGVRQCRQVIRRLRESEARFNHWWGSEQCVDWVERMFDLNKSWEAGTEMFKANCVYAPDKPVERALKNNLSRRQLALIALGRLLDEGIRPVRHMCLSDFGLIKAKNSVAETSETDLIWLAEIRARFNRFKVASTRLHSIFQSLEEASGRTKQSDAVQTLDEQIVETLRARVASPSPGYLELIVDKQERIIRRDGFDTEVSLARRGLRWHLFFKAYQARGENARARCEASYPGEWGAVRTAINALNKDLEPLQVCLKRFRLISSGCATDR